MKWNEINKSQTKLVRGELKLNAFISQTDHSNTEPKRQIKKNKKYIQRENKTKKKIAQFAHTVNLPFDKIPNVNKSTVKMVNRCFVQFYIITFWVFSPFSLLSFIATLACCEMSTILYYIYWSTLCFFTIFFCLVSDK